MTMFIHFFCLCALSLTIKLNFNISKEAYLEVLLCNLRLSIIYSVPCDRILQGAYCLGIGPGKRLISIFITPLRRHEVNLSFNKHSWDPTGRLLDLDLYCTYCQDLFLVRPTHLVDKIYIEDIIRWCEDKCV